MKYFTTVNDVANIDELIGQALAFKKDPFSNPLAGKNKTLGLIFLNPSLRTRLSTQKAALNLGMNVMVMNVDKEAWALEFAEGAVMNGSSVEHVKDAAAVMGQYCDIIGIRCFPGLADRALDYSEQVLLNFMKHCHIPVVSLESATLHPLQSLADLMTIQENWKQKRKPKVVLTWAPHIKALPQAVANSFSEWMCKAPVDFFITHPPGYELPEDFTTKATILPDQEEALKGADFVYVKNWSSYSDYGKILCSDPVWMLSPEKMSHTNKAAIMHCLPVRRNVELPDSLIDGPDSLILNQAANRLYAAQAVLKLMLDKLNPVEQAVFMKEKSALKA
ncbi:MAG: N-acetylornithine carbamoyltransferase [Bacteroidia bacterium]